MYGRFGQLRELDHRALIAETLASRIQVGAVAGHTYYFLMDVWPREMWYPGASRVERGEVQGPIKAPKWM
jgi:hypothetical protein